MGSYHLLLTQVSQLLISLPAAEAGPAHGRIYLISMGAMVMGATDSQRQLLSTTTMNRLLLGICWMTKDLGEQEAQTWWGHLPFLLQGATRKTFSGVNYYILENKVPKVAFPSALHFQTPSFTKKTIAYLYSHAQLTTLTLGRLNFMCTKYQGQIWLIYLQIYLHFQGLRSWTFR